MSYFGSPASYDNGGTGGLLESYNLGKTWNTETVPDSTAGMSSVACPTPVVCYAAGQGTGGIGGLVLKTVGQMTC